MIICKTKRLALRKAQLDDVAFHLELLNEPAWHQYIAPHSIDNIEKAADYIEQKCCPAIANRALVYAHKTLTLNQILAIVKPVNHRSIALLDRLGFGYQSNFTHPDSDEYLSLYNKLLEG
ncbi:hypothetical protein BGP77_13415 [Saccharospirillum sp. MSK14-1]|uniref:GNAT family N-acetyltransferase n=1 Tax=Saccharospirillum sp. MSK14-1 TaxID=1897632 RepID=UPI000D3C3006|nr:GNAT family protein [Saccharospirillum sp. MSK14-1]PTY37495.1 hypothetical protein BGP77_13415 [Saccharospirillum sp. MSK14-1]